MEKIIKKKSVDWKAIFKLPQNLFLILCLFWGLVFGIVNPPFQAPDEDSHLYKIYGMTDGSWNFKKYTLDNVNGIDLGKKVTFPGQILPENLVKAASYNKRITFKPQMKTDIQETLEISKIPLNKDKKVFIGYPIPAYTAVSYLPGLFFVFILKFFNATPLILLYALRLASLLTYSTLCYFAIKISPTRKWLFFTICLIPMSVYEASAGSTDALTNSTAFLLCAYSLYLAFDEKIKQITKKQLLLFLGLITLLAICKFTYFFLIFMFFLIPKERFSEMSRGKCFGLIFSIAAVLCVIPLVFFFYITQGIQSYASDLDKGELVKYVFLHPVKYSILMFNTIVFNFKYYLNGFIGLFGWSDTFLPFYAVLMYVFALIFSAISNYKEKIVIFSQKNKIILSAIFALCTLSVMTACYLVFELEVLGNIISGVQGRYFLTLAPIFFLLFYNNKIEFKTKLFEFILLFLINFVLFVSLIRIIYRFYV